jgi:hypothetical protein
VGFSNFSSLHLRRQRSQALSEVLESFFPRRTLAFTFPQSALPRLIAVHLAPKKKAELMRRNRALVCISAPEIKPIFFKENL